MKLLLDECLPVDFRHEISDHEVATVAFMGWSGTSNGKLLALAASAGFDALITTDRNIECQQNLNSLPLTIVVLETSNDLRDLRMIVGNLCKALQSMTSNAVVHVTT